MVSMATTNIAVPKLVFDEEDEREYQNFTKDFRSQMEMGERRGGITGAAIANSNSFSGYNNRKIRQSNGRLFSPRKPRSSNGNQYSNSTSNKYFPGSNSNGASPVEISYKGYTVVSPCNSMSPPDKKVRALRLFDSPNTPKTTTTLQQRGSGVQDTPLNNRPPPPAINNHNNHRGSSVSRLSTRSCLFGGSSASRLRPSYVPGSSGGGGGGSASGGGGGGLFHNSIHNDFNNEDKRYTNEGGNNGDNGSKDRRRKKDMRANVNPFTPTNILLSSKKRCRKAAKPRWVGWVG